MVMFSCSASKAAMSCSVISWRTSLPHQVKLSVTGSSDRVGAVSGASAGAPPAHAVSASAVAAPTAVNSNQRLAVLVRRMSCILSTEVGFVCVWCV